MSDVNSFSRLGVAVLLLAATAGATDISLTLCRDVLFQPSASDSMVEPTTALLGVGFRLGSLGVMRIRAGYSGYLDRTVAHAELSDEHVSLNGLRAQALPVFRIRMPVDSLFLYGGVGLGGRSLSLRRVYWDPRYESTRRHDLSAWAFDQTFLFGLGFELSHRFGLDIEAERQGFCASYELTSLYHWYGGFNEPIQDESTDDLNIGWRKSAPTGIGVGLRLKL